MALNDIVLIDGIVDEIIARKSLQKTDIVIGSVFEQFAISELLKNYDLTEEQIKNGIVDGGDDGGIDGFYIFVNGNYLSDALNYNWPRQNGDLEIYIITSKHHSTYELSPLESVDSSLSELLNFTIEDKNLDRKYKLEIIEKRKLLYTAYRKLAVQNISPIINLYYISRGNSNNVAKNIQCAGEKLKTTCTSFFQDATVTMTFWGPGELVSQFRKKRNAPIDIRIQRYLQLGCNYVVLVSLEDYFKFVTDEIGKLKRYLFEENVRDYLGDNRTNNDITETLQNESSPDFWLLNNGITILASNAMLFDNVITIENVQIVNGLQTTFTIFSYFTKGYTDPSNRNILIKIIKPDNFDVSNQIVKATNNQSVIPLYALHANDKIQRDIEVILFRNGLYYERRPDYYANLGYPIEKIIPPLYLAGGYISLVLKLPHRASTLKSKFMNNQELCTKIFSEQIDINIWPIIAKVLKQTDTISEKYRDIVKKSTEKYLRSVRSIVSLVTLARIFGEFSFGIKDLAKLDLSLYTEELISETIESLILFINQSDINTVTKINTRVHVNTYLLKAARQFSIPDYTDIFSRPDIVIEKDKPVYHLSEEFLSMVQKELSDQPWPTGIHKVIASKLNCSNAKVSQAISELIEREVFKRQKAGAIIDDNHVSA